MPPPLQFDPESSRQLAEYIEQLAMSGQGTLDGETMKKLKKICRQSDAYVTQAFHQLMVLLDKDHAEIRLSTFQIIDQLFNRSHCFRELLLGDFQNFMDLTIETDYDTPLPPPTAIAKILKSKCMEAIQQWHENFGDVYKKLALGYNFLKECKKVDFADIRARTIAERRRSEENRQRLELLHHQRVDTAVQEMKEMEAEIRECIVQAENCFLLLLPHPESFQLHGLKSPDRQGAECEKHHPLAAVSSVSGPDRKTGPSSLELVKEGCAAPASVAATANSAQCIDSKMRACEPTGQPNVKLVNRGCAAPASVAATANSAQCIDSKMRACEPTGQSNVKLEADDGELSVVHPSENSMDTDVGATSSLVDCKEESQERCQRLTTSAAEVTGKEQEQGQGQGQDQDQEDADSSDDFEEVSDETEDENDTIDELVRGHGLGSQKYSLSINMPQDGIHFRETPDNTDILHALKDIVQLMSNKFLPSLQKWLEIFTKAGNQETNIRKAIDLKQLVQTMKSKVCQLRVSCMRKNPDAQPSTSGATQGSEDEEEDFEEVPQKEGYEPRIPDHLRAEYGLVKKPPKPSTSRDWTLPAPSKTKDDVDKDEEQDPASWMASIKKLEEELRAKAAQEQMSQSEESSMERNKAGPRGKVKGQSKHTAKSLRDRKAPILPYGTDLFHWGEEIETPLLVRYDTEHRFWTPNDTDPAVDVNALESTKSRVINFVGEFKPVKWKCRAPLPSGSLCERMDRVKCPFHGKIIPRDELGQPTDQEDLHDLEKQQRIKEEETVPDWEDPQLQADIKAATGIDLSRNVKVKGGKRQRKKKHPNLMDIKKVTNTSRSRLEAKVLSPKALKRVAAAIDSMEHKKFKDKFGNTFVNTFRPR